MASRSPHNENVGHSTTETKTKPPSPQQERSTSSTPLYQKFKQTVGPPYHTLNSSPNPPIFGAATVTFNLEIGWNGFYFCYRPNASPQLPSRSRGKAQLRTPPQHRRTVAMTSPLEPFPELTLSTFPPCLQSPFPPPAASPDPRPNTQPPTPSRRRSQTVDDEIQEVRDTMSEIKRLGEEMGYSLSKTTREKMKEMKSSIPAPVKSGLGSLRKGESTTEEKEHATASSTSISQPRRHLRFRGGGGDSERIGASLYLSEQAPTAAVSPEFSSTKKEARADEEALLGSKHQNKSSVGSDKACTPTAVVAMGNGVSTFRPSNPESPKGNDDPIGGEKSPTPAPSSLPGESSQTSISGSCVSPEPLMGFKHPSLLEGKGVSDLAGLPTPPSSVPAPDNTGTPKPKSRNQIPKDGVGTLPLTRRAMEGEMQSMRDSLRQSIGPSYLRRSQLGNSSHLPEHSDTETLKPSASMPNTPERTSSLVTTSMSPGTISTGGGKGEAKAMGNMSSALQQRVVATKLSDADLATLRKRSTPLLRSALSASTPTPRTQLARSTAIKPKVELTPIPRATRRTIFDVVAANSSSPLSRTSKASSLRVSKPMPGPPTSKADGGSSNSPTSQRPEEQKIASAEDISAFITKLHARDKKFASAHSRAQPRASTTPPGSPPKPTNNPSINTPRARPAAVSTPAPRKPITPIPKHRPRAALRNNRGAVLTPSKRIQSSLDKAIDKQIDEDAKAGREFTPGGNRISELLERRAKPAHSRFGDNTGK